jgi:hypothetical protein
MNRVAVFLLLSAFYAQAGVYRVTDYSDSTAVTSLRGSIIRANQARGYSVIFLREGTYQLTLQGVNEDHAFTGDLDITAQSVAIIGTGTNTVISGAGLRDRTLHVLPNARLYLSHLTITGATADVSDKDGGAIYNEGQLVLRHCALVANATASGVPAPGNPQGLPGGNGGAIYNSGRLTLFDCVLTGNACGSGSTGGGGGALYNTGVAALRDCTLTTNASGPGDATGLDGYPAYGGCGGAIFNAGTMIVSGSVLLGNTTGSGTDAGYNPLAALGVGPAGGAGGDGAGIYNLGSVIVRLSTIAINHCGSGGNGTPGAHPGSGAYGGSGGGIYSLGVVNVHTCTISGNVTGDGGNGGQRGIFANAPGGTGGDGGGVYDGGVLKVRSSTIVKNVTGHGGSGVGHGAIGGMGGSGGGVLSASPRRLAAFANTLIALNSAGLGGPGDPNYGYQGFDGSGQDIAGRFSSRGFNFIGTAGLSRGITNGLKHDLIGNDLAPLDPLIGPLQENGGLTLTHALLPGSTAIDQGKSFDLNTDQRGHHRPQNDISITNPRGGDGTDIGAFEVDVYPTH